MGYSNQSFVGTQLVNGAEQTYTSRNRFSYLSAGVAIPLFFKAQSARVSAAKLDWETQRVASRLHSAPTPSRAGQCGSAGSEVQPEPGLLPEPGPDQCGCDHYHGRSAVSGWRDRLPSVGHAGESGHQHSKRIRQRIKQLQSGGNSLPEADQFIMHL